MKDPNSRHVYDLSLSNPHFREEVNEMKNPNARDNNKKDFYRYYENKWYSFKPHNYESLYDEYWKIVEEDENAQYRIVLYRMGIVIGLYVVFDFIKFWGNKNHENFVKIQKELLENNNDNDNSIQKYIKERTQQKQEEDKRVIN